MPSPLDAYASNVEVVSHPTRCRVCLLPDELRADVDAALAGRKVAPNGSRFPVPFLRQWLLAEGHEVPASSLYNHRQNGHVR